MTRLPLASAIAGATLLSLSAATFAGDGREPGATRTFVQTRCKSVKTIDVAHSSDSQSTSSTDFVDIDGAVVKFDIGGKANTCVLVNFSAIAITDNNGVMLVRAVRNLLFHSVDGPIQLSGGDDVLHFGAHAYNFLFTDVPPGSHTVKMQYRSALATRIDILSFEMMVHHR